MTGGAIRTRLYEALAAVTDDIYAEVCAGNSARVEELAAHRQAVLDAVRALDANRVAGALPSAAERERSATALARALARDHELVALLRAERAQLNRTLQELARNRRLLTAYRGLGPGSPTFVDRLG